MLWTKALHIIFMTAWFAGLFYLPRLFVYHASLNSADNKSHSLLCIMERRLFWGIMTPCALLTLILGMGLVDLMKLSFVHPPLWLGLKLLIVALLVIYHTYCGVLIKKFKHNRNKNSALFYRLFNEIPLFTLIGIVLLVILKPT